MILLAFVLQAVLLAFAISWREKRVNEAHLQMTFNSKNGAIKHTYFTPALGTKYHDQV